MKSLKKGFTLVELMVVIVIIGILAALAIPRFLGATNKTKATEFKPVLKQIYTLQEALRQERSTGTYGSLKEAGWDIPGRNAAGTATSAYFNYAVGAATIGGAVGDQTTEFDRVIAAPGLVIAPGNALANATPNDNGVNIRDTRNQQLRNGTDLVCVLTTGEMNVPAAADRLSTLTGGSVNAGVCP